MAKIINKGNHLKRKYLSMKVYSILYKTASVLFLIFMFIGIASKISILSKLPFYIYLLLSIASYFLSNNFNKKSEILKAGYSGESSALALLGKLPSDYNIYSDLEIEIDGRKSQLDFVITGPTGVYLIEVKNISGQGIINGNDENLILNKHDKDGKFFKKSMYNPARQVDVQSKRLFSLFHKNNINLNVYASVYFTNNQAIISSKDCSIPIFTKNHNGEVELLRYIIKTKKDNLSKNNIEKIHKILKGFKM